MPVERHRSDSAGAIERRAPQTPAAEPVAAAPRRVMASGAPATSGTPGKVDESDVLVVASKVRKYISDRSGMSTSAGVYDALSARIRRICDGAIEEARRQGRKTVMDRDVP